MYEEKFKLKKEARQFFEQKLHTKISTIEGWKSLEIPKQLLEKVPRVYVEVGHRKSESTVDISGWKGEDKTARFLYTIHVNDISNSEYNETVQSKVVDEIQKVLDNHFSKR